MNQIYKVIWSKVKHCCIVVSELAKETEKLYRRGHGEGNNWRHLLQ